LVYIIIIMRMLLAAVETPAASLWGVDSVWLHVHKQNQGARALYESMGFSPAPAKGLPTAMSLLGEVLLVRPVQQRNSSLPHSKAAASSTAGQSVLQETVVGKKESVGLGGAGSYQWGLQELTASQQDETT
jgi:hypothetical protein